MVLLKFYFYLFQTMDTCNTFNCNICEKKYKRKFGLKRHLTTHRVTPDLRCDVCEIQFSEAYELRTHRKTKHLRRSFSCSLCPKTYTSRSGLHIHTKTHTGQKHQCKSCNASFALHSRLQRHMISHTESQGFICDVCGATCKYKSSLERHVCKHNR